MFGMTELLMQQTRNSMEAQFAVLGSIASRMIDGMERLTELGIASARTGVQESSEAGRKLASHEGVDELFPLNTLQVGSRLERLLEYGKEVSTIASRTHREIGQEIDQHAVHAKSLLENWIDHSVQGLHSGSGALVTLTRHAMDHAHWGYSQLRSAADQAATLVAEQAAGVPSQVRQTLLHADDD